MAKAKAIKPKRPWGSPAQRAALAKAQKASAVKRRIRALNKNHGKAPNPVNRGIWVRGLRKNFVPYVRVNKQSGTIGAAAGTIIPGTGYRVVGFGGVRMERTTKKSNPVDMTLAKAGLRIAPKGTRRRKVSNYLKKNVTVSNPAIRSAIGGAEVRLGTSRGAGPTVILRRGKHKVSRQASYKAIKRYDTHARKLNTKRQPVPRPQRRKSKG